MKKLNLAESSCFKTYGNGCYGNAVVFTWNNLCDKINVGILLNRGLLYGEFHIINI